VNNGSPEYKLTWKQWDIPQRPPICALRASTPRTSANGFGGWATPEAKNQEGYQVSGGKKWPRLGLQAKQLCADAEMESTEGYRLNPLFPLWLQGYPKEWAYCVVPEIQSIHTSQRNL
jgi:hypothetical protein